MTHRSSPGAKVARLGALAGLGLALKFWWDPVRCMDGYHRRLGRAICVNRLERYPNKYLFLLGPDYNQRVLTRTDIVRPTGPWGLEGPPHSALRDFQHDYLSTYGKEHAMVSEMVALQLKKSRTKEHFERVKAIAVDAISLWPMGTAIDLYARVREVAQHAAFSALFGEEDADRARAFGERLAAFHHTSWSSLPHLLPFDVRGLPYHRAAREAETLKAFIVTWVREQRGVASSDNLRASFANMVEAWGTPFARFADGKIAGYFIFLAFASYETMSSALSWTLLLLTQNPKVAADLADELRPVRPIEHIDRDRLSALPLLDAVIKESLRLNPPTPYIPLRMFDDWEIDGCRLRRGAQIILSPRLTHRLPELYPEPESFLPERWFSIRPSAYEYLPFSGGPRRCPGQNFAVDFLKIALAVILTRYRLHIRTSRRPDWQFAGIMMPRANIPLLLSPATR